MNVTSKMIPFAACALSAAFAPLSAAADTPEAETAAPFVLAVDTTGGPYAITSSADYARVAALPCLSGETVTATPSGGAAAAVGTAGTEPDTVAWTPTAGGLWTLANSRQGSAQFTVRHSIFGTLGAGTLADPAKIVDAAELCDYAAAGSLGDGYVFTLCADEGLFGRLVNPDGYSLDVLDGGLYRLETSPDGCVNVSTVYACDADTVLPGPDRKLKEKRAKFVAYSGDDWAGDLSKAATLTFTPPYGGAAQTPTLDPAGTGAKLFNFNKAGDWTVTLTFADGTTRTATVSIEKAGLMLIVR